MKKLHELTALLWDEAQQSAWHGMAERDDRTIRHWLLKRADEIKESYGLGWGAQKAGKKYITEILGLTDEKPEQKQSWCEHMDIMAINYDISHYHFCSQCGTPRPEKKSLEDILAEKLCFVFDRYTVDGFKSYQDRGRILAQAALDFLREHKEEL